MSTSDPSAIDIIANEFTAEYAALDPLLATAKGIPGYDHLLPDFSPEGYEARAALDRATIAALDREQPRDEADRITAAAMRDRLGVEVELYEAGEPFANLNVIDSPLQNIRDSFDLMATATADDWATIAARMARIPDAITGYLASLREGVQVGLVPARLQVTEGIKQASELADPKGSFFVEFAAGARPDGAVPAEPLAADLARAAQVAAQAYGQLAEFLAAEIAPNAPEEDAVGPERYARLSRNYVGATVDLDETYEWGLDELARMTAEQEAIAAQIAGPGASVEQAMEVLDHDTSRKIIGTAALREWMQETVDNAIAELDGVYFDIPAPVRRVEAMIAPTQNGGIYYTDPSDDFSRPGRMWWSVPPGVTEFDTWREKTTVYHEGVPGHHLQIGQAVYEREQLNDWRRLISWTSGYGEGWALYAERLMEEFGFLDDPGDRLGMVDGQRMRATRVVLDIGVHCRKPAPQRWGGGIWDADKAWNLFTSNVHEAVPFMRFEVNRYLGWPGQAPAYKVGQRLWEQIRDESRKTAQARGEAFDLKAFHSKALSLGSLPLDVLRTAMA